MAMRRSPTGSATVRARPGARRRGNRRPAWSRSGAAGRHGERGRAPPSCDHPRPGPGARRPPARRADQPSRPRRNRMARGMAQALQGRVHRHQPRPHLPDPPDQQLPVARPRDSAARRDRLRRLRCMDRAGLRRRGAGSGKARRQAQARASLASARSHRPAAAQPGAAGEAPRNAGAARGDARRRRDGQARAGQGRCPLQDRDRGRACGQVVRRPADHPRLHPAHPARRPDRDRRAERRRQDDIAQAADGRNLARQR